MTLEEIGEFGLIRRIGDRAVSKGLGDDCAVIPSGDEDILVSTDMLVEGTHFLRDTITPYDLGWKTLAVNVSDIAAMGGSPSASFLSMGIPSDIDTDYLDSFFEGYGALASRFGVTLSGGDTTRSSKGMVLNVTILGKCSHGKALLRSGAKPGDVICVTGCLGDSSAGLEYLLRGITPSTASGKALVEKHLKPIPRVEEGRFLSSVGGVTAMMDISDGVASDLCHIMEQSGVGAEVELRSIPLSQPLLDCAAELALNPMEKALCGGEDYELLLTVSKGAFSSVSKAYLNEFGTPLYEIGKITDSGNLEWTENGAHAERNFMGYRHF